MDRSHRPPIPVRGDDVSGHAFAPNEDAETRRDSDDNEDTEGHARRRADAERSEDDDVEGHIYVHESSPQGGRIGE